jgi:phosphosulfolactate phosphohydrolase-like enzyme
VLVVVESDVVQLEVVVAVEELELALDDWAGAGM